MNLYRGAALRWRRCAKLVMGLLACSACPAFAEVVWQEDFEGAGDKFPPVTVVYRGKEPKKWIHVPSKEAAFGKQALYMESSDEAQWMFLLVNIPAEQLKGKRMRLTAWVKSDFPGKAEATVTDGYSCDAGPGRIGTVTVKGKGWERLVVEGPRTPGKMAGVAVGLGYGAKGASMLIDDVKFECADELPPLPDMKAAGTKWVEMRKMASQRKRFEALVGSWVRDAALGLPVDSAMLKRLVSARNGYRTGAMTPADAETVAAGRRYALESKIVGPSVEYDVTTPVSAGTSPELDVVMPVNGYDAKILLIRNHSGRTQYFSPRWAAKKGVPVPVLRRMIPVDGFFDAMPVLPFGNVFEVADGETKGIWIDIRSRDVKPGVYQGMLKFVPLDPVSVPEIQVPFRQTVADIVSPKELPVAVFCWDYGVAKNQADYEFLRNARVNVFHVCENLPTKDSPNWEKSDLKKILDQVDANGDRGKVFFFLENWFTNNAKEWNSDLDRYYTGIGAYMKSRGYGYDSFVIHCFDEVLNDKFFDRARRIKQLDPKLRIFSDPPPASAEQLKRFTPYLDYYCLGSWFLMEDDNNGNKAVELLRSTGKPLWIYECDSQPAHALDFYRRMALNSVQRKWDGFTFWALRGLLFRHMTITPEPGVVNYGLTYLDENGVRYPSRRWALWELGIDDYALFTALREKGIDFSAEVRAMYETKGAVGLDRAMETFKKEKLKQFIPGK